MQNRATLKRTKQYTKQPPAFKVHLMEQESIRTLYRNRLKGKLTPLTGEIDADWLKIKEAITKAVEESSGYKKWKNRSGFGRGVAKYNWQQKKRKLGTGNINKTKQWSTIQNKKNRAIVRKITRKQRRDDWDKCVKILERDITGTQRRDFKIFKQLQLQERDKLKT